MDFFENIEQAPSDPIFGLNLAFKKDVRECKVDLIAGVYKTDKLTPLILHTVKKAERILLKEEVSKDYLPIDGLPEYVNQTKKLVFGTQDESIYGAQTVGGTAALRVGSAFLCANGFSQIYISNPTWANHQRIFQEVGLQLDSYPYYNDTKRRFDYEKFYAALQRMPKGALVLLQGCCHNPTGYDPSLEQWEEICKCMKDRELFPFFDFAYQGFGQDLERDAAAIRLFVKAGLQCAVAVSHSKNFGLYAERTGALFFVCRDKKEAQRVGSQVKRVIRGLYSNPPCHGARLVSLILQDDALKKQWVEELASMRERIQQMRIFLVSLLAKKTDYFDSLTSQLGMFSYTGLKRVQVNQLIENKGIYLPQDGRINVAGLNQDNVAYIAEAIASVS